MGTSKRWHEVVRAAGLDDGEGGTRPTIFAEMTALAQRTGALNLGQGFPDSDGPATVTEAARTAIAEGMNQYPPGNGIVPLREAIAAHQSRHYGIELDPGNQITVSNGATEAIAASILALAGPGDEVLTLEPYYDSYAAVIAMAGATHVSAPLVGHADQGFTVDAEALRAAFSDRTAVVLLNSPHNPTGAVLSAEDLALIAELAIAHDAVVVSDEVYEHLTYDGARHIPIATLPGMFERTVTISSAGKTFSVTGWKVGWASGPADLITALVSIKQFLTYTGGAPFQPAVATALNLEITPGPDQHWVGELAADLSARRDLLMTGLTEAGFEVVRPRGCYFVIAESSTWLERHGLADGAALCRALPELAGVAAVPVSAFTVPGSRADRDLAASVRFTFTKSWDVLNAALQRLAQTSAP
ncbi:aminotransferase class I/II-fold pyridoxal phosphate-dependent enzyme [Pseudactinotalea sp. Z1732]|uniref:aminotransferase class I/II-fold pyridoxal phosphate-dependent enzyme n=1 Tax=Micrococcales TaxID=85006 RepID=UPI003C79A198